MDYNHSTACSVDWTAASKQLLTADPRDDIDEFIDELTEIVFTSGAGPEAAPSLIEALHRARSDLSLRSAALALAIVSAPADANAVDALIDAYTRVAEHPFLAPALLETLGLFALRSPLARAQVSTLLLRLQPNGSRFLLVKAAKVIGWLDAMRPDSDLRAKLEEFVTAQDMAVQAESRYQIALAGLADVLLADDRSGMRTRLPAARAAFARAERSEEHRPDAAVFVVLLDMLLAFLDLNQDRRAVVARVTELAERLDHTLASIVPHGQRGYRSDRATRQIQRVLRTADALRGAVVSVDTAEEWVNFATAVEELARLYAQVRGEPETSSDDGRTPLALGRVADVVFAASLGPLLACIIQQRRLTRITADYVLANGEDNIAQGLRALEQAAATVLVGDGAVPGRVMERIGELAERLGRSPEALLAGFVEAAEQGRVAQWAEDEGLRAGPLPVERPELYGGDPVVDEVLRPMLHRIAEQLGEYPLPKWARLVDVLVSLVKFAHFVRDRTPAYVICEEDGGLGQRASEEDLQDHLFEWLRQQFGRTAVYELPRTGGGRPDTGVVFTEARFPVEVKHEFKSVDPEHVRSSFVAQSDVYATAADRVSFLMLLDLRRDNAAGHRVRVGSDRRKGRTPTVVALYHLQDSFRVESLPLDPDVPNATSKVVVVGLVPGNRPLPSSMSTYSKRPASARNKR